MHQVMKNVIVRPAEKKDIQALAEIRVRFLHDLHYSVDNAACLTETVNFLEEGLGCQVFGAVAENAQQVLAAGLLLIQNRPYHPLAPKGKSGEIINMYTVPEARGQGLGGQVLDALISKARELGVDKIFLNASEAGFHLYQSRGFEVANPRHPVMELKH